MSNLHPPSWPDGNDVEVMTFAALEQAYRSASARHEREHTTPFLWDRPERFRVGNVAWETGLDLSMTHRFTLDYPDDYAFVAAVYEALWRTDRPVFSLADILALLEERPELRETNARYAGVNWYRHHLAELRTVPRPPRASPPRTPFPAPAGGPGMNALPAGSCPTSLVVPGARRVRRGRSRRSPSASASTACA